MTKPRSKKRPTPQTNSNYHFYYDSNHMWYIFLNHSSFKYSALLFRYIHSYLSHVLTLGLENVVIKPTCAPSPGSLLLWSQFLPPSTSSWTLFGSPIIFLSTTTTLRQPPAPICFGPITLPCFSLLIARIPTLTSLQTSSPELLSRL